MSELGQLLKNARLEKKISLDDLQEITKIRKAYLEAIEEENYKMLPGNFYVRAFIKSYAEAVGLDPAEVLDLFKHSIPASEPEVIEPVRPSRLARNSERISRWASTLMVVSFVVLIMGLVYYYISNHYLGTPESEITETDRVTDKTYSSSNPVKQEQVKPLSEPQTVVDPLPSEPTAPPAQIKLVRSEKGTDYYELSGNGIMEVKMTVNGPKCWVQVRSLGESGKVIEEKTFNKGDAATWSLTGSSSIKFGAANAVQLNVNGTDIQVGDLPNVKTIRLDFAPNTTEGVNP